MTQRQLAGMLGVSTATVSLALRDSPLVAADTRRLVRETMRQTGYVYNVTAASLRTGKTRIVGVSFHNIAHPFFAEMLKAIEDTLSESGRAVVINNHGDDPRRLVRFVDTLRGYGADGLIVSPALHCLPEHIEPLRAIGAAIVFISRYLEGFSADFAGNDDRVGMKLAASHLIHLGHRRIVMLGGLVGTSSHRGRLNGFQEALQQAGIAWQDTMHIPGTADRVAGMELARLALMQDPRPTAFACFNDLVAFGAYNAIREQGLVPGKDIAVIGLDDTEEAAACFPPLTTISNKPVEIGVTAAGLLIDRLEALDAPLRKIAIMPKLTIRGSCGGPIDT